MKGQEVIMSSGDDAGSPDWETPNLFFWQLERMFGKFDLDVCATKKNTKVPDNYYSRRQNALKPNIKWIKHWFCNPPYGKNLSRWVREGADESEANQSFGVMLLPAKTDTKWFHDVVWPRANYVFFVKGRIKFKLPGKKNSATFPSIVVVFDGGGKTMYSGRINGGPHCEVLTQEKML